MTFQSIIFDMDGTIISPLDDIVYAANHILAQHGFAGHSAQKYLDILSGSVESEEFSRLILPPTHRQPPLIQQIRAAFLAEEAVRWRDHTVLYPGIPAVLDQLQEWGIPMAILTTKSDDLAQVIVAELLAAWTLYPVHGSREGRPRKPDPQSALTLAHAHAVAPEHCLLIGDTSGDIETARAAGMQSVAVTWGFGTREQLASQHPDAIVDTPEELLAFLRSHYGDA